MTTFAGQMNFDEPQPFNVEPQGVDKDADLYPARRIGIIGRAVRHVPQVVTPDRLMYPIRRGGVKAGTIK